MSRADMAYDQYSVDGARVVQACLLCALCGAIVPVTLDNPNLDLIRDMGVTCEACWGNHAEEQPNE